MLRAIIITGEKFDESLVKPWLELAEGKKRIIVNGYGTTETTICTTLEKYEGKSLTIGKPIIGTKVYLVKAKTDGAQPNVIPATEVIPQSSDLEGELYIGGASVGQGYWRNEELTKKSFVELIDPEYGTTERAYRTGDLCKWVPDEAGKLIVIGRIDHQIKLRGQRLDPEQIEFHLRHYRENNEAIIQEAYVVSTEENNHTHLVGYLKLFDEKKYLMRERDILLNKVRNFLKDRLPSFMVPNALQAIECVPLINGKVNRKLLKDRRPIPFLRSMHPDLPITDQERGLAEIWSKILQINSKEIKRYDDFFCLGGSSLLVSPLLNELRQSPTIFPNAEKLKPEDVYRCSTLKSMSRRAFFSPIKKLSKGKGSYPAIIFVHSLLGDGWSEYDAICNSLKKLACPIYALQAPALVTSGNLDKNIEDLVTDYILALELEERINVSTPIILIGWSSGGIIASEIARQLALSQVNSQPYKTNLILIDCLTPKSPRVDARREVKDILIKKLGLKSARNTFQQNQYKFALWLFDAEYDYFSINNSILPHSFPEKTVILVANESTNKDNNILKKQAPEANHKPTVQLINPLGNGFNSDMDISKRSLSELNPYLTSQPIIWNAALRIIGFLRDILWDGA